MSGGSARGDDALRRHLAAWSAAITADEAQPAASLADTPLAALAGELPETHPLRASAGEVTVRRLALAFETRSTSYHVWLALSQIAHLLSDSRRIAPRFAATRMGDAAGPVPGAVYRLSDARPARIAVLCSAAEALVKGAGERVPDTRRADFVLIRSGPFGGETGEIVADACASHWRAGRSSLWVLAHESTAGGGLRVRLEAAEIARWAWAPDCLAASSAAADVYDGIIDWPWLFERLLDATAGEPLPGETGAETRIAGAWGEIAGHEIVHEALALHDRLTEAASALRQFE